MCLIQKIYDLIMFGLTCLEKKALASEVKQLSKVLQNVVAPSNNQQNVSTDSEVSFIHCPCLVVYIVVGTLYNYAAFHLLQFSLL
jgi:hypothetical protein